MIIDKEVSRLRNYKRKANQTRYEKAGVKNMPEGFNEKHKDAEDDGLMENMLDLFEIGVKQRKRSTNWTPEELEDAIASYFRYCADNILKPSKSGLRAYLGCSRSQYHAWQTESSKYGAISDLINLANDIMESQYVQRSEKYPTANIFLLKTSHGHVETSKVDIRTDDKTTPADIEDAISKLGLDKPKE